MSADEKKNTNRKVIRKLVELRLSDHDVLKMKAVLEEEKAEMLALVLDLGEKMLRAKFPGAGALSVALSKFTRVINTFYETSTQNNFGFAFMVYASKLLQYYIIICDPGCKTTSCEEFNAILSNTRRFGDTRTNLLVQEHQLTLLYNELVRLEDKANSYFTWSRSSDIKVALGRLIAELKSLKPTIDDAASKHPYNTFISFLAFSLYYSLAKATEVEFRMTPRKEMKEAVDQCSAIQQAFLKQASEHLDMIKQTRNFLRERGASLDLELGNEYTLGQGVDTKFHIPTLPGMLAHVDSLIS